MLTLLSLSSILALSRYALAELHTVDVGGSSLIYNPSSVDAQPGDVVAFIFHEKNHTATQSSLAQPCVPLPGGLNTGFQPVSPNETNLPVESFTVPDSNPIWFFCMQADHCSKSGMVFAVNPGDKLAQFQAAATAGTASSAPTSSATVTYSTSVYSTTATATSSGASSTSSSTGSGTNHMVTVGAGGALTYNPSNLNASVGDTITFQFAAKNHSATQSSFANPCKKLALTASNGQSGFDSGFNPVANGSATFPQFTVTVNDTNPIWVYCAQTGHCAQGMVFAANAPATGNTFDAFQQAAKSSNSSSSASASSPSSTGGALSVFSGRNAVLAFISLTLGAMLI